MTIFISPEFHVNTTTSGAQFRSVITSLPDGGWVVTWEAAGGDGLDPAIYLQRFDADGDAVGGEVAVASVPGVYQTLPKIATLADGGWVVCWQAPDPGTGQLGAYQRHYTATGMPASPVVEVVAGFAESQSELAVTALADGGWVVTWNSIDADGDNDVFYCRYDEFGAVAATDKLNTGTAGYQGETSVIGLPGGGWTATWHSVDSGTGAYTLMQRSFDADGNASAESMVNPASVTSQFGPEIALLKDGGWVVTWQNADLGDGSADIYQRRFDAAGNALTGEILVNSYSTGEQHSQSVAALTNGGWVVVWASQDQENFDDPGVYLQEYDSAGNAVGGEVHVDDYTYGYQFSPSVTALPNGGYVVSWSSDAQEQPFGSGISDGDGLEIYQKSFNVINAAPTGTDMTITTNEDVAYAFSAGDFGFADVDGNNFASVRIVAVDGDGTLTLDGNIIVPGSANDLIAVADIARLTWTPGHDSNGAALGSISFQVVDDGGTAVGGVNEDQTPNIITFNVNPVNDAPVLVKPVTGTSLLETAAAIVNSVDDDLQVSPFVTGLSNGNYVVTWASVADADGSYGIYQRVFDDLGVAIGLDIQVSTTIAGDQEKPAVAAFNGGGWVVVWQSWDQDGEEYGVYFQRFDGNGTPLDGETQVNTNTAFGQYDAAVTVLADDSFVISFSSDTVDPNNGSDIYSRRFASDGTPVDAAEVLVNLATDLWQYESVITHLPDGGYLVTWTTDSVMTISDIVQRRHDAAGVAVTGDMVVSSYGAGENYTPNVTLLSDGGWVTTWYANGADGDSWAILQQAFHADGSKKGGETLVNTSTTGEQTVPVVAALDNGGWVVVWQSDALGADGVNIHQQAYFADGSPNGGEILVNDATGGNNAAPSVAALPGGRWVVTWESLDGGGADVFNKVFQQSDNTAQALALQPFSMDLPAGAFQDVDGDVLTYSLAMANNDPLPAGLAIDPATGQITWTPAIGDAGQIELVVTASDGALTATDTFFLSVTLPNFAPVASDGTADVDEDAIVTGNVAATDANPGETATLAYALNATAPAGLTFNADGSYSFDASSYDSLAAGETVQVTANYTATDAQGEESNEAELVITITGVNDAPVSTAATASVAEDATVNGTVVATDADNGETATLTYALTAAAPAGLTFNADGSYSFDASSYDNLADGETLQVTASYKATDAQGAESGAADLVITITGTNDAPVANAATVSVNEDAVVNGTVSATDADNGETATLSFALTAAAPAGLTFNPDGSYSFDASSYDNLAAGETLQVTASYKATDAQGVDSNEAVLVIAITGVNDAATFDGLLARTFDEDTSVIVLGTTTVADIDTNENAFVAVDPTALAGVFGTFSFDETTGDWSYDLDETLAAVQGLKAGDAPLTDTLTVSSVDGTTQDIVVTLNGVDDAPVFGGTLGLVTTEDEDGEVGGTAMVADVDAGDNAFVAVDPTALAGAFGTFAFDETTGDWSYDLDETLASVQGLKTGDAPLTDTLTVSSVDGTTQDIVVTINGVDDAATFGGTLGIAITEDESNAVGGNATVADVDAGDNAFVAVDPAALTGAFGTFSFDETTGDWSYDLDETLAAVQGMKTGDVPLTDTLTVASVDGTTQDIVVTINGVDDAPTFGGTLGLVINEDEGGTVSGTATVADVDAGDNAFVAVDPAAITGTFGTFSFDETTGDWSYDLDETLAAVQGLKAGDAPLTDTLTVSSVDGTTQDIVVTINGVDDAPTFGGTLGLVINEDEGSTVSGTATVADVDAGDNAFDAVDPAALTGAFGTFTLDETTGDWSYDLDETLASVQGLKTGDVPLTDTLTVASVDGTTQDIVVTINGVDDAPTFGGTLGLVITEDEGGAVGGTATVADVDAGDNAFVAVDPTALAGAFGTFTFEETTGDWSYDLDETLAAVQGMKTGDVPLTDTLTIASADGATQDIVVTINGVNDAPATGNPFANAVAVEDIAFTLALPVGTFSDIDGDTLEFSLSLASGDPLPAGLQIDPVTGTITWTPVNDDVGPVNVVVTAGDGAAATQSAPFTISVVNTNDVPILLAPLADRVFGEQAGFNFAVPAESFIDIDVGDTLTFTAALADDTELPAWLDFDPDTGIFSAVDGVSPAGSFSIRVTATDQSGASRSDVFVLTIGNANDAPVLANAVEDQTATEDALFSFVLPLETFIDEDPGDVLAFEATLADGSALPDWLDFNPANRHFTGTPGNGDVGAISILVTATDLGGLSVSDVFTIEIVNVNDTPVLNNPLADQQAVEDMAFNFVLPTAAFADIDAGDNLTWSAILANEDPLPAWLEFDPVTRTFSGTPDNGDTGILAIRVTVTDLAGATASDVFNITIANTNDAPVLGAMIADQNTTEDEAFVFVVPADAFIDSDPGEILALSATTADGLPLPAWLHFDAGNGLFWGKPLNGDVGVLPVRLTATDAGGASQSQIFAIAIAQANDAPTLDHPLLDQVATENAAFSFVLPVNAFSDMDADDQLTFTATLANGQALPDWLHFDAAQQAFTGKPANGDVGLLQVLVTASDGDGASVSDIFNIDVVNVNNLPVNVIPLADQTASEDSPFSCVIPAGSFADMDAGDQIVLSASLSNEKALPAWLSFDPQTGSFSGTPRNGDVGVVSVRVTATDSSGAKTFDVFDITVANTNDGPVAGVAITKQFAVEDADFVFILPAAAFSDMDAGDILSYSATLADGSALPDWLTLDAANGYLSGKPGSGDAGDLSITLTATDTAGLSASQTFSLTVINANDAPTLAASIIDQLLTTNVAYSFTLPDGTFADADEGDTLVLSATLAGGGVLPDWLKFDAQSGTFSGTPTMADSGLISVTVTATDQSGASVSDSFDLEIKHVHQAPVGSDGRLAVQEDIAFVFSADDFVFTDVDGDHLKAIVIDNIAGRGSLTLKGEAVTAGMEIAADDIAELSYLSEKDSFGNDYASLTFHLVDDGGTADGGADTELVEHTLTIDVEDVLDIIRGTGRKDRLVGTDGDDKLNGKRGNDRMNGGEGSDIFVFKTGHDRDLIRKFDAISEDHDVLNLHAVRSIKTFKDLMKHHIEESGNYVIIDGRHGDVIKLRGVHLSDLDAGDFIF